MYQGEYGGWGVQGSVSCIGKIEMKLENGEKKVELCLQELSEHTSKFIAELLWNGLQEKAFQIKTK